MFMFKTCIKVRYDIKTISTYVYWEYYPNTNTSARNFTGSEKILQEFSWTFIRTPIDLLHALQRQKILNTFTKVLFEARNHSHCVTRDKCHVKKKFMPSKTCLICLSRSSTENGTLVGKVLQSRCSLLFETNVCIGDISC